MIFLSTLEFFKIQMQYQQSFFMLFKTHLVKRVKMTFYPAKVQTAAECSSIGTASQPVSLSPSAVQAATGIDECRAVLCYTSKLPEFAYADSVQRGAQKAPFQQQLCYDRCLFLCVIVFVLGRSLYSWLPIAAFASVFRSFKLSGTS